MLNKIDESQYKVDFAISEKYIDFSSELLRISILIIGGLGTLFINGKKDIADLPNKPHFFILSLLFFACCVAAALCHRYYATDSLS